MRVLVAGAAGFIGSHTILELLEAGHQVYAIDNFYNAVEDTDGKAVSLKRVTELTGKEIPFDKLDLMNEEQLESLFKKEKFDAVIHLAALKAVAESVREPLNYYTNNIVGSLNLIRMCQKYGVKRFVFSSSATVYGPPASLPIKEDSITGQGITNPYGQTKYMIEQILMDEARADPDWKIILLRYFNPVGAHPSGRMGEDPRGIPNNLMPFVAQVAIGKLQELTIYGDQFDTPDGTGVRDYIHITDLAKGHVAALKRFDESDCKSVEVYNLGTGKGYSVREMINGLEKASGRKIAIKMGVPRDGDLPVVYCDPKLAKEKLGWEAKLGLNEMCRDLWNWQSQNPTVMMLRRLNPLVSYSFRISIFNGRRLASNASDPDLNVQQRELTLSLPSRRLDAVLRKTSHISTSALEKLMNNGGVRVNEEVEKKKSYNVEAGDEIEMFLETVEENSELARVHRVEIVDYQLTSTNYQILCTVFKSIVVSNWRHE
ncbi:UDP-N-acetylglucosamine 4-epimerase [Aphelenchoides besseyi]|nr:UDP-N-acetylglucosamine 4-epimerase [Aphelenchoides besseyi]KAI6202480.1 UDP-N-acetylglucosamine 4-epimerase [Aphelenchoides besseyi]